MDSIETGCFPGLDEALMLKSMQSSQQASIYQHNYSQHHHEAEQLDDFDSLKSNQSIALMSLEFTNEHTADRDHLRTKDHADSEFESSPKNDGSVSMDFDPEICDMETL